MTLQAWTFIMIGLSFALYIGVALWSRARSTRDFYVAGASVNPVVNGMATAADWMSAASFISMAGIISFQGRDGARYLMGWTGGYVLLALVLAPYLRKFGKYTVPDFVGDRYGSSAARVVAVVCAIFVSFTYVAGQMRGVGIVFSQFLGVPIEIGVLIGMGLVFLYAVMGGMKGITYTQVAQYCVLIFAYMVPAFFIAFQMTGNPVPQIGLGGELSEGAGTVLGRLDQLSTDLGFNKYTDGTLGRFDMLCITAALMVGTAGLPHVIVRFYTVPRVAAARISAGWALVFIAILYTTAPAIAVFVRTNLLQTVPGHAYAEIPDWFERWETTGLLAWADKNGDGVVQYAPGPVFVGEPPPDAIASDDLIYSAKPVFVPDDAGRGEHGERMVRNVLTSNANELYIDRDIMVLANPQIARLPDWVTALVAAGALAAALSTAAGLLLVVSTSVAHDLLKKTILTGVTERGELIAARVAAGAAVCVAGYFGINPPGFVAEVVAFAFGLAASSFFPAIVLGIFSRRMNVYGAIAGMIVGITFTAGYIVYFKFISPASNTAEHWLLGVSPEGIGTIGMLLNFLIALAVALLTPPPPDEIVHLLEDIRVPDHAPPAHEIDA